VNFGGVLRPTMPFIRPLFICIMDDIFKTFYLISLDNDQLDAQLLYFYNTSTKIPYMFRALYAHHQEVNCIDTSPGIILSVSGHPVHRLREKLCTGWTLTERTIPDAASVQFNLLMMSI